MKHLRRLVFGAAVVAACTALFWTLMGLGWLAYTFPPVTWFLNGALAIGGIYLLGCIVAGLLFARKTVAERKATEE